MPDFGRRRVEIRNDCRGLAFGEASVRQVFRILDAEGLFRPPAGDLSVAFVPLAQLRALHLRHLADDSETDVLSFPGNPGWSFAGEIVVAPAMAHRRCRHCGTSFPEELSLYLVHGYLHLGGLNDLGPGEGEKMRRAEEDCLQRLRQHRALPKFLWRGK
ncbi:MAG: rRNA maturation RNase YbeY [Puniceicoccales bacterium]|jgi:probable rRNA maturation factor|nr:rRNA maturation RNase YbeY [Puniceicoccales bacterium]